MYKTMRDKTPPFISVFDDIRVKDKLVERIDILE
jgi:hypothetical protein